MTEEGGAAPVLRFGAFELDRGSGELRKRGIRITLREQPLRILALLLKHRGTVVSREQLRDALWPDGTHVDFEHSLNAAVAKLRQSLGDSAENPRFVETLAKRGYRFIGSVETADLASGTAGNPLSQPEAAAEQMGVGAPLAAIPPANRFALFGWRTGLFMSLAILGIAGWLIQRPPRELRSLAPAVRLTANIGTNIFPTISADGSMLVYASDRAANGGQTLWVQMLTSGKPSGSPIQITRGPGADITPDFSPDGLSIVFRANREKAGLYVVSVLGSEERRLTSSGRRPRFSPDGNWVGFADMSRQGSVLKLVSARGGDPKVLEVSNRIEPTSGPVWASGGRQLLFSGFDRSRQFDWWVVNREGGEALALGVAKELMKQGLTGANIQASSFDYLDGHMVVTVRDGDSANLWRIAVSPGTRQVAGPATRMTFGSSTSALSPRMSAAGRIVFSDEFQVTHLWSLRLTNPNAPPEQLTNDASLRPGVFVDRNPGSVPEGFSAGPTLVAFTSRRSGNSDIWVKDLHTGKEWSLGASEAAEELPLLSPDERSLAYTIPSDRSIHILEIEPGHSRRLCTGCGLYSWLPDSKRILSWVTAGGSTALVALDVTNGQSAEWIRDAKFSVRYAAVSPDSRWVALTTLHHDKPFLELWMAPLEHGRASHPASWKRITQTEPAGPVVWSASGDRVFYFALLKDGQHCLWSRRWNRAEAGPEEPLHRFHNRNRFPWNSWLAVTRDRLVFTLTDTTSNISALKSSAPLTAGP